MNPDDQNTRGSYFYHGQQQGRQQYQHVSSTPNLHSHLNANQQPQFTSPAHPSENPMPLSPLEGGTAGKSLNHLTMGVCSFSLTCYILGSSRQAGLMGIWTVR